MTRHYCISARTDSLDRWRQAFPDGVVCPDVPALIGRAGANDVLWLHLSAASGERADAALTAAAIQFPGCSVVAMSKMPDQREALLAFNAGAKGYCHALSNADTLQQIAVVVRHGGVWVGQDLLARVVTAAEKALAHETLPATPGALDQLSMRERAVALEVAKGATNKEIARRLNITERTVKAHLSSVFNKLNVRDRLQLVLVMNPPGELIGNAA
jgi:DNA-binding NarL/FixJ family response regulator